jgi:hypothetical protein
MKYGGIPIDFRLARASKKRYLALMRAAAVCAFVQRHKLGFPSSVQENRLCVTTWGVSAEDRRSVAAGGGPATFVETTAVTAAL